MNFNKYRQKDTIQLIGCCADVYKENEDGELIDLLICKDASWMSQKPIHAKAENFDFENYVLGCLKDICCSVSKATDICICGNTLQFWATENADGYFDDNGEYYVLYSLFIEINGKTVDDEEELSELFPNFDY